MIKGMFEFDESWLNCQINIQVINIGASIKLLRVYKIHIILPYCESNNL